MPALKENPSKQTLYMREWTAKNKEHVARLAKINYEKRLLDFNWVEQNKARSRDWGRKNSLRVIERVKLWEVNNPERARELGRRSAARYRAKIKLAETDIINYELIHNNSKNECGICHNKIEGDYDYDHIIPISKNGSHTTENIQLAHPICNRAKGNKLNYIPNEKIIMASLANIPIYRIQRTS